MITYLTQLTICWTILFAVYYLFLKRETFFAYNRWFLLSGLALGLIIPLIDWAALITHEAEGIGHLYVAPVQTQVHQFDVYVANSETTPVWYILLMSIYVIGVLIASIRLIKGIREIWSLREEAEILQQDGYELVLTRQLHMPFSFLNAVYWSHDHYLKSGEKDRILAHEARHVSAWHSLDVLFIELLCVAFWFHPMVYIYRKEIKEVHEYEADSAACVLGSKKAYGQLLINQAGSGLQLALANHFFYSQLKNRFKMMTRKPSSRTAKFKYLIAIPIIALAAVVFSFVNKDSMAEQDTIIQTDSIPLTNTLDIQVVSPSELHSDGAINGEGKFPARRPMIAKFKPLKTIWGKKQMEMTYSRDESLDYPAVKKPQETAVIHYTLKKDGSIVKPKISSSTTERVGKEAMSILILTEGMRHKEAKYLKEGKEVEMRFGFIEGRWSSVNRTYSSKRTYPDQNYLEIMAKRMNKIFLLIDDKAIGEMNTKKLSNHIQYDQIYSISNSNKKEDLIKYNMEEDVHIIDIKTKKWADNNPDKIRRGFKTIVGRVVDMDGKPLPAVNIMIKGTRTGTATDFDGNYRLMGVDKNDVLIFSLMDGRASREMPVGSHTFSNAIVQFPTIKLSPKPVAVEEVYEGNAVDAIPRFPGCEAMAGTLEEKQACANKKMLEFLYSNIKYPAAARDNGVRGQVFASFVVKKDGSVDYVHIIRDIGAGLGDEVKRLLEDMNNQGRWTPAMKDGEPINFKMTLPVTFELKGDNIRSQVKKASLENAVNPLSEIVVVGYSNTTVKPPKPFDINEAIQDAIKEGRMEGPPKPTVKGYAITSKVNGTEIGQSDPSLSEVVVIGHSAKAESGSTDDLPALIVLDGYIIGRADGRRNLKYVNPDNIESITVLKDEKAIEKYGDQAKSGVIIITTKEPVLKPTNAKLELSNFRLYPNPASNELTVELQGPAGEYQMRILDARGSTLITREINNENRSKTALDISTLNSGIYYLVIESDDKATAKVFVKN